MAALPLDHLQQLLGVTAHVIFGAKLEAAVEVGSGLLVQALGVQVGLRRLRAATLQGVGGELVAPAQAVEDAGFAGGQAARLLQVGQAAAKVAPAGHQGCAEVEEGFDVARVERQGSLPLCQGGIDAAAGVQVAGGAQPLLCPLPLSLRRPAVRFYEMSSTSFSVSWRSKARKVWVRTLPWPLTASATFAATSSSGASDMTT